jgi:SAM-dependent methyltransferase
MSTRSSAAPEVDWKVLTEDYRRNAARVWDLRADEIHARWGGEDGDFAPLGRCLPERLESLLDLGFGYGRLVPVYRHAATSCGIDLSARMLALSRTGPALGMGTRVLRGRLDHLPFPDRSFQVAIAVRTLNHVHPDELAGSLREIHRVVRERLVLLESTISRLDPRLEFIHDYPQSLAQAGFEVREDLALGEDARLLVASPGAPR